MPRPLRLFAAALALAFGVGAGAAQARDPGEGGEDVEEQRSEPTWLVPSLHALGLFTTMRASEAYLWPEPFAETNRFQLGFHYHEAFTRPPRWDKGQPLFRQDGDRWYINVVGHGLLGSELYLRARTCRKPVWQALVFTGVASAAWEYGFEANGVRPSALDLMFTPASGLLLGEARYFAWSHARRLSPSLGRTVLSALLDPLGDLERALGSPC